MGRTFNGTNQYGTGSLALNDTTTFTIACWVNVNSAEQNDGIVIFRDTGVLSGLFVGNTLHGGTDLQFTAGWQDVGWNADTGLVFETDTWYFLVAATGSGGTTLYMFTEGGDLVGSAVTGLGNQANAGGQFIVAGDDLDPVQRIIDGSIAHIMMWNTKLTKTDAQRLARGAHPSSVKGFWLLDYFPLDGGGATESGLNGGTITMTGTPTSTFLTPLVSEHLSLYSTVQKREILRNRVLNQDCSAFLIGDSTSVPTGSPRWPGGMIRNWDVPWVGFNCLAASEAPDDGTVVFFPLTTNTAPGDAVPDGTGDNELIMDMKSVVHENHTGTNHIGLGRYRLAVLDTYLQGDWTVNPLKYRIFMRKPDDNQLDSVSALSWRDDGNGLDFTNTGIDLTLTDPYGYVELDFHAATIAGTFVEVNMGCGDSQDGRLYIYGIEFYVPDATGFSLFPFGQGGWDTRNWLDSTDESTGFWTSEWAVNTLSLRARKINTLIIILGINLADGEGGDTDEAQAIYKANVDEVIDQWSDNATDAGGEDIQVWLISPWAAGDSDTWSTRRENALLDIMFERDNVYTTPLDKMLKARYGGYAGYSDTLLDDGIHQTTEGADVFARLVWGDLISATDAE
jgi:hypothetical protein